MGGKIMKIKRPFFLCLLAVLTMGLVCSTAFAMTHSFENGTQLDLMGYMTQSAQYGVHNDYNTENSWNTLLTNVLLEADYRFARTAHFFVSGKWTMDWIYDLKSDDRSWNDKQFNLSKNHGNQLYYDDSYWQILNECHLTYTPQDFFFRFGKQVVAWGETDGFRLMDQINPLDTRRGFADVEFENSIIPIWLVRSEYNAKVATSWFTDLNFQFIWNPNVDFIPNQNLTAGNDAGGIWAPQTYVPLGPLGAAHLGSSTFNVDEPTGVHGMEYAFRVSGNILGATATVNYFYGRENDPATISTGGTISGPASDGRFILNPVQAGDYPLQRFVGATFSRDIAPLRASALGGVAPVVRIEGTYTFSDEYAFMNPMIPHSDHFVTSDEFRVSLGVDWKVKIPFLNERAFFMISPQIYYRKIMDFPDGEVGTGVKDYMLTHDQLYTTTLMVSTNYFNSKLTPSVVWLRDWQDFGGKGYSDFWRLQLRYDYSEKWQFTTGFMFFNGTEQNIGFNNFSEKDYAYFKVGYKF